MEDCTPMAEDPTALTILLIEHSLTLVALIVCVIVAFDTVEIGHPMYALLYQEVIVLALFVTLNLIVLATMLICDGDSGSLATGIFVGLQAAVLQFHQITCISVACLS